MRLSVLFQIVAQYLEQQQQQKSNRLQAREPARKFPWDPCPLADQVRPRGSITAGSLGCSSQTGHVILKYKARLLETSTDGNLPALMETEKKIVSP